MIRSMCKITPYMSQVKIGIPYYVLSIEFPQFFDY